jgi:hypothetical protein
MYDASHVRSAKAEPAGSVTWLRDEEAVSPADVPLPCQNERWGGHSVGVLYKPGGGGPVTGPGAVRVVQRESTATRPYRGGLAGTSRDITMPTTWLGAGERHHCPVSTDQKAGGSSPSERASQRQLMSNSLPSGSFIPTA